jgi:four helix bundle protein
MMSTDEEARLEEDQAQRQDDGGAPLFPYQRLEAYVSAKQLAGTVQRAKIRDTELRDQATRAAKSTFLRLCEGLPNDSPAMRRKYFVESYNSLHETVGAMDLAHTIGAVGDDDAFAVRALSWRLRGLIMGLHRTA